VRHGRILLAVSAAAPQDWITFRARVRTLY
jgi:hypothetical protein